MNKISTKLAIYFLLAVLILESLLMSYLYNSIINSRVQEEFQMILSRGNSHRDVLEDSFTESTLTHIALMESKTDTEVVITDGKKKIIVSSKDVSDNMVNLINDHPQKIAREGLLIESNWKEMNYLATVTEYNTGAEEGYVYMFKNTEPLRSLIKKLNYHFLLAGIMSLVIIAIIYFLLSRILTSPLIKMKEATQQLSNGYFKVRLPDLGKDELGELSNSIQKLANDLESIQNDRLEFLASISHELRTPLTYIQGYTTVALRDGLPVEKRNEYLKIIQDESERVVHLIENLFELAKIDQNNFTITKQEIELCPLIQDIVAKVGPAFDQKDITIQVTCPKLVYAFADPLRLEQIILNLLDNALKYSEANTVTKIIVSSTRDNKVKIRVTDQGIGIPENELQSIFKRLYRVEKSRSRGYGGSGLGLSIVKELVEAHGGSVTIESHNIKGTTVEILI
ncbi:HAMP domain-containing sensor histidine kinase [Bacillus sp. AG4(2022)]|uniref:sensor histidine kinase n=1 Tax=Bacillus sp. AG4(2022) TaxID=2962594 RepID=UPI0028826038|nr:HAMP domain-containing sensor histidine kinase [Bacillus sp. AG4(2022)]MDT0163568.1 HAMP domain-containing sensor histidine kinase [Bacillus sp. AG4(2022)]